MTNAPAGPGLDSLSCLRMSAALRADVAAEIARSRALVARAVELTLSRYAVLPISGGSDQSPVDLIALIQTKITAGILPATRPSQVWAGDSPGEICDGCGQPIPAGEMEYEANITSLDVFTFHRRCFDLWQQARARLAALSGPSAA